MAGGVGGAEAEDDVVLGDGDGDGRGVVIGDGLDVGPGGSVGVAGDDFVGGVGGETFGRGPGELGVVVEVAGEDMDVLRRAGARARVARVAALRRATLAT